MRPLTDTTPKPLLRVNGVPLLSAHLKAFQLAGHKNVVINTAWLEDKITEHYGEFFSPPSPIHPPLQIHYSREGQDFGHALETAGGIVRALPLLDTVFWSVAGDIYIPEFCFSSQLLEHFANTSHLAHLFLVPNPVHNPNGDFGLDDDGLALNLHQIDTRPKFTYSSIGLFKKSLFLPPFCAIASGNPKGLKAALAPILRKAMDFKLVSAQMLESTWTDVGTPERLSALNSI